MNIDIKYIKYHDKCCNIKEKNEVTYITFPKLEEYEDDLLHGFSTRLGGVSKEHLSAMNLSFTRGDDPDNVMENHRRFAAALGYDENRLVFSDQVHKTEFHKVTEADVGKGIVRESDIKEIDGLVTDVRNVPIITFYADCVPLMFYDPVHHVIAMAHSGWKGTVGRIGEKMVRYMGSVYGSDPSDIICAIAPSICQECYEVSEDVAEQFIEMFGLEDDIEKGSMCDKELLYKKPNGKYQLNLYKACEMILLDAGVLKEHIDITDICTCCNPEFLFSHRASRGMRGNNAAVMMMR
ncbi:MAG: peptidoglycan editing factor PgeF [Lachnospiraceae bacterium]|nr:peptidoglycan editing factor PgeF [Lachnospiraceae bacterium]